MQYESFGNLILSTLVASAVMALAVAALAPLLRRLQGHKPPSQGGTIVPLVTPNGPAAPTDERALSELRQVLGLETSNTMLDPFLRATLTRTKGDVNAAAQDVVQAFRRVN